MAYDRYLAICRPLHYPAIMTRRLCGILVSSCWLIGFLGYPIPIFSISQLPFCGSNIIDHFLCDMDPLMALSCAPAPITESGRLKAFSTCGSHLVVVSLFYGTVMVMYVSPTYGIPTLMQKILTLVYSVMTPLFNPLIYSLRNKDMKRALKNVLLGMKIVKAT
ncbi:Olfactory receptor 11H4 [Lemmus lemmus]